MNESKPIKKETARSLLPEGPWVHIFTFHGSREGEMWSRNRVLEMIEKYEPELCGPEAMKHQHGISIRTETETIYIQTRKEPPATWPRKEEHGTQSGG